MQPAGSQLVEDEGIGSGHAARGVDVLDAYQPSPAMGAGVQPARQGGDQRAEMQITARGRGEATDIGGRVHANEYTG